MYSVDLHGNDLTTVNIHSSLGTDLTKEFSVGS